MAKPVGDGALGHLLVVPDDLVERERDLLLRLELDDVDDLLLFDRRQLDEPGEAGLAGDAHGDDVALGRVPGEELLQGLARELVRVGIRLGEDLRVLDVVERGRGDHAVDLFEPQGLEGALTNVDAPDAGIDWHGGGLRGRRNGLSGGWAGRDRAARAKTDVLIKVRTEQSYHVVRRTVNHHNRARQGMLAHV
jgi:hypothetical protein